MPDREEWDRVLERGIAGLVLAAAVASILALGGVRFTEWAWVVALTSLAVTGWVARLWLGEEQKFLLHPVVWPLLAFVGLAVWRYTQAPVEYPARHELLRILVYAAIFLVSLHTLHRQELVQWVTGVFAVVGVFVSLYAVIQLASGSDKVWFFERPVHYVRRGGGTFINPNHLAGLLVTLFPLAAIQVFAGRTSALAKVLYAYAALAMMAGIGVSMSRGGWLAGLVVSCLVLGWLLRRRQYRIPALILAVGLLAAGWMYFSKVDAAKGRLAGTVAEGTVHSGHSRQYLVGPAVRMWMDHRLWGVGPGQFDVRFPAYRPPTLQVPPGHAHNEYLELLAEFGLAGACIVAAGLGLMGWGLWKTSRFVERGTSELGFRASNRTAFFVGATVGLIGFLLHASVEFLFHIPGVAIPMLILAATLASNIRYATERFWHAPRWWSAAIATVAGVCLAVWVVPVTWRGWQEGRLLNRAARADRISPALLGWLRQAHAIEPLNARTAFELGENLRLVSWEGLEGHQAQAAEAVTWFQRSAALNPYDAHVELRMAMAHHWLGQADLAATHFDRARLLGPNDVQVANHCAWNRILRGDLPGARALLEDSLRWSPWANWMAEHYLDTVRNALRTNAPSPPP